MTALVAGPVPHTRVCTVIALDPTAATRLGRIARENTLAWYQGPDIALSASTVAAVRTLNAEHVAACPATDFGGDVAADLCYRTPATTRAGLWRGVLYC
jgi:hypothetical protein